MRLGDEEQAMLAGETEAGFDWLREAVAAEDRLIYNEPRAWMHPPRHALGALLLEKGRIDEARVIYERDLGYDDELPVSRQNRGKVWSLLGLVECYEKLCNQRAGDAVAALTAVLPLADQPMTSSCFCRGRAGVSDTA